MSNSKNVIDRAAEVEFKGLMAVVVALKTPYTTIPKRKVLNKLFKTFEGKAEQYFDKGRDFIQTENMPPKQRGQTYHRLLLPIREHVQLLSDLARFYVKGRKREEPSSWSSSLTESYSLLEKMITIISSRFGDLAFFTISSQTFQYIHFNYMKGVAIIGIPPTVLASPPWNLGVLWHEVAGYGVALAKQRGQLKSWAAELRKFPMIKENGEIKMTNVWKKCQEIYEKSVRATSAIEAGYNIDDFFSDDKVQWQENWLGEFFEDLFGVQILRDTMVESLTHALVQQYRWEKKDKYLRLGDYYHPPANLRIQVALEYLGDEKNKDRKRVVDKLNEFYSDALAEKPPDGLKNLGLKSLDSELKEFAKEIAQLYKTKVNTKKFPGPNSKIHSEEQHLVSKVRKAYNGFSDPALSEQEFENKWEKILDKLYTDIKDLKVDDSRLKNIKGVANFITDDWQSISFTEMDKFDYYYPSDGYWWKIPPPSGG